MRNIGHKLAAKLFRPRELAYPDALAIEREEDKEHSGDSDESREGKTGLRATVRREDAVERKPKHHLKRTDVFNRTVDVVAVATDVGKAAKRVEDKPALGLSENAEPHAVGRALAVERLDGGKVPRPKGLLKRRDSHLGPREEVVPGPLQDGRAEGRHLVREYDGYTDEADGRENGWKPRSKP